MSAPLRPSLLPQCRFCARRFTALGLRGWRVFQQPVRGKKKLSKQPHTIPVRLLKDVKAFGAKGSLVPVSSGQMRNNWFPSCTAEYVTATQLKELKAKDVAIERDYQFGLDEIEAAEARGPDVLEISKPKPFEVDRLSPQRAAELVNIFVPAQIEFREKIIFETPKAQPKPRGLSAADVLAAASKAPVDDRIPLHGSVTIAGIVARIKEELAVNEEASRVVLSETDVRFIGSTGADEADRVKHVGDYEVEIRIKGADESVRRKVRVRSLE